MYRIAFALLLAALLAHCSGPRPEEALAEYVSRLARTLKVEAPPVTPSGFASPPRSAQLRIALPGSAIDGLDFLTLRGCALQTTIGKRNSSLGRFARDSQRLLLELEYLQHAPACIEQLRARDELALAETLALAQRQKQAQLPALIFNATLGSEEYRQLWRRGNLAADYPAQTVSVPIAALEYVHHASARWLAGDYRFDNREFEIQLSAIATGDGGALLQALSLQADWLRAANTVVNARQAQGPLCQPGQRPPEAEILDTVIRKYFIAGVQPRAADLNRRHQQMLPPVAALEQLLATALPPTYQRWRQQRDDQLDRVATAPRQHVQQLQQLRRSCEVQQ
jgi:hypothetical protein